MALTAAQQFVGCYIANGVLDMAPGGYMTALADVINANGTDYRAITKAVVATSLFTDKYPTYLTNDQFAANYATNLVGTTVSATAMTALKAQIVSQLNAGQSRGDVVYNVLETLYSKPATDADFGAAATSLQNQATVAQYYTVDKLGASTDLATLRAVTSSVTDAASVVTAKASIDAAFAGSVSTPVLTTGMDNVGGTSGDDIFTARIFDNSNTLQSGDKISGGSGNDTLFADIGNSQKFAITAETTGVETVAIRAQAIATDSTDNNTASTSEVQIDAQRMVGVTQWESNNSRADLLIEDVRILNTQITKDITIAMVETDPGHVDYGVYFDQLSLRANSNASSTLSLQVMDTRSNAAGTGPLKDNPYNGFAFNVDGKLVTVTSKAIDDALTYADMVSAINTAMKTVPELVNFTASLGASFTVSDTLGSPQTGTTINVTSSKGEIVTTSGAGTGWVAAGAVPPSSGLHTNMSTAAITSNEKVTSKVILDDVGRGSTGGDLVIGGLSVGDTSHSLGVERFEIEVRDNSKLQTINSTNNTLQEVSIKNGATTSQDTFAYASTTKDKGNLVVNGNVAFTLGNSNVDNNIAPVAVSALAPLAPTTTSATATSYGTGIDAPLPGSAAQHNAYGFSDVRLIDASGASANSAGVATNAAFAGNLSFTAEVTARSIAKYMNLVDTQANPKETINTGDGVNGFSLKNSGSIANFDYKGGLGNDTMVIDVDGSVVGSRSLMVSGREDFTFNVDGGAGNDNITLKLANNDIVAGVRNNAGNGQNWYNNQDLNNNVTVSGGEGNDTIRTPGAGDVKIDGGAGNDTIYTDNTGFQTITSSGTTGTGNNSVATTSTTANVKGQWVFNTVDQSTLFGVAPATGFYGSAGRNVNDLRSDTNESYNFYNSKLVVTFKGVPTAAAVTVAGTGYKTSDLEINQAIKKAINDDVVLNKLLVAEDGPANSLVVKSLIDGAVTTTDLSIGLTTLSATDVAALSATELVAVGTAYGIAAPTAALVSAAIAAASTLYSTNGDYVTALANDGTANITGNASLSTSDNLVLPGTDHDVVVLGTTLGATAAASSNETIVIGTGFGNDTVVNFATSGMGQDYFDFTALKGTTFTAGYTTDKSITVQLASTLATSATVTEKAAIETLFNANNATAQDHVFVSVNTHNVANVYTVADAAGAANAVATLQGSINLADTALNVWGTLNGTNFVNSSAANYFLLNGSTGSTGAPVPLPVDGQITIPTGSVADFAGTSAADVFFFDATAALASTATGATGVSQAKITGGATVANNFIVGTDSLKIDSATAAGVKTLATLASIDGITVQVNPLFNNNGITVNATLINFGADAAGGDVVSLTLVGVAQTDWANINVTVI